MLAQLASVDLTVRFDLYVTEIWEENIARYTNTYSVLLFELKRL